MAVTSGISLIVTICLLNFIQQFDQPCCYLLRGDFHDRTGNFNALSHDDDGDTITLVQTELCDSGNRKRGQPLANNKFNEKTVSGLEGVTRDDSATGLFPLSLLLHVLHGGFQFASVFWSGGQVLFAEQQYHEPTWKPRRRRRKHLIHVWEQVAVFCMLFCSLYSLAILSQYNNTRPSLRLYHISHSVSRPTPHTPTRAFVQTQTRTHAHTYTLSLSCLLYTSPSPRDRHASRMPSSA